MKGVSDARIDLLDSNLKASDYCRKPVLKNKTLPYKSKNLAQNTSNLVREVGFEPTNPYGTGAYGQTHSLQACAFKSLWTL